MARTWVDARTLAPNVSLGLITGYSGLTVEVTDLDRAAEFYSNLLGFGPAGERVAPLPNPRLQSGGPSPPNPLARGGREYLIALNSRQSLTLLQRAEPRIFPDGGVHQAYTLPPSQIDTVVARLAAAGVAVERYHEDREAEWHDNRYCQDPDGNRIQLVAGGAIGLDHVAFETHDIEWAEAFYTHVLGARVEARVGWKMADFAGAWAWGSGEDQCAPGTRRWDELYTDEKDTVPRPCAQVFVSFAPGVTLGLYLPNVHRQEPPRRQFQGTPNVGFWVQPGHLDELEQRLHDLRLRCMEASPESGGPYERTKEALFVRDPSGNFLEFREGSSD